MKKPIIMFDKEGIHTDSAIMYYSIIVMFSIALGFFISYVWIPLLKWLRCEFGF